ncbi:unnamed protein product [Periconia digitata]|uniref:VOC domain-containing protein n=1 Tax=Periconia digitata TaxID=1303443 RepID=A0A9W4XD50_9PLEO|nr:unnamed protein product [Periconia digitata]
MTIDHISFNVPSPRYEEVVAWYLKALAPLGYVKQDEIKDIACGIGDTPHKSKFWIGQTDDASRQLGGVLHLAFTAKDHDAVDKFFEEAIKAGGKDHGKPGIREKYHSNYYGAFVIDPLG